VAAGRVRRSGMTATPTSTPCWHELAHRPLRSIVAGEPPAARHELVVVPGLGALGYLRPTVQACARWTRVSLLDVPGFGDRRTARLPSALPDLVRDVVAWLDAVPRGPVVLMGHSTGAQAALRAAVTRPELVAGLCLAGPTFAPEARRWPGLLRRVGATLRHERPSLAAATLPEYLRGRGRVLTLLRSAMDDRPEDVMGEVGCPLLVVRGRHDALSPPGWARLLASTRRPPPAASPAPQPAAAWHRTTTVPGAHNFVYDFPDDAAAALRDLVVVAGERGGASPQDP
jgi:pimeloyl-ACP methyl ester carboxylesterase